MDGIEGCWEWAISWQSPPPSISHTTHKAYLWLTLLYFFYLSVDLVFALSVSVQLLKNLCYSGMLISSLTSESYLQCWKLSSNVMWDPIAKLCRRESECWSQRESLQTVTTIIWKWLENTYLSLKGLNMPYNIAISGPKNLLLPDKTAHSSQPLRMQ